MAAEDEFAKEIAKQLPVKEVYHDGIQPAAKQFGQLAEDLIKALQLALFPVQLAAGLQDRFRRFVQTSVARVPIKNQVSPAPQIIGPVLEGVRYEPEGTPIDKMFSELLSTSMDSERLKDAHPSFPQIVKQISADEARMLSKISEGFPLDVIQIFYLTTEGLSRSLIESDQMTDAGVLNFPHNLGIYREHLDKLALIRWDVVSPMQPIIEDSRQTGGRNYLRYKLTDFGSSFMRACGGNKNKSE